MAPDSDQKCQELLVSSTVKDPSQRAGVGLQEWGGEGGDVKKRDEGQSRGSVQEKEEALSWGPVLLRLGRPGSSPWLANMRPTRGSLGCLETLWHTRTPAREILASPGQPPHLPLQTGIAVLLAAVGDTDRCSCPRGHVSPDLTPGQVHRCRGPKMRAKLASKRLELSPLLLLGQLTVERGTPRGSGRHSLPSESLLTSTSPRQTSPGKHPLCISRLGHMHWMPQP